MIALRGSIEMFKENKGFGDKDEINNKVIIDMTFTNHEETPNLDDLKIIVDSLQDNDIIELDKISLHMRVMKDHPN